MLVDYEMWPYVTASCGTLEELWGIKCWDITTVYWRMFSLNNAWLRIKVSLSGADSDSDFISTQGWRNGMLTILLHSTWL